MANTFRIKRRTSGAPGAPSSLAAAEIAYSEVSDILYYGKGDSGGLATSIVPIGGTGAFQSATGPTSKLTPQHGRLTWVNGSQIKFSPFAGDQIKIQGVQYTIPSGGITAAPTGQIVNGVAGQNLVAGTTYLVCAFNNGGTPALGFYTSLGHNPDTIGSNIGVEIATGNPPLSVVGMVLINNSTQFQDNGAWRGVNSWFNRRNKALAGGNTGGASTTGGPVELGGAASRAYFTNWAEEAVFAGVAGSSLAGAPGTGSLYVGYDGATASVPAHITIGTAGWWGSNSVFAALETTDGMHYISPFGQASGVSMAFHAACYGMIRG